MYPNGLLTLNFSFDNTGALEPKYTKHYYAGSQRIVTKNGTGKNVGAFNCQWLIIPFAGSTPPINPVAVSNTILQTSTQSSLTIMQQNSITPPPNYGQNAGFNGNCVNDYPGVKENQIYWFHPDHLGSSSYITGIDGEVTQNIEYFPSGEVFVENHRNSNYSPYKFNGKELDAETGYYYYGARYYNPRVSLWLNVDPLAEEFPGRSPYEYTFSNPINLVDPDGRAPVDPKPGFWKGFFTSVGRGIVAVGKHIINNPNHAGYGYSPNMKTPKVSDFAAYQINWSQQLDPYWQAQNFSSMAVEGVSGFVGGIIDGDGARTAKSIPKLMGTVGFIKVLKGSGAARNVDLMGGTETSLKGFKNFDLADNGLGISDYASNFGKYFKPGSLKNIVVNNPQAAFLEEVTSSLSKGGQITVRGTINNGYFKSIYNGTADGMNNFQVVGKRSGLPNNGYKKTNGSPIGGTNNINEIILKKK